MRVRPAKTQISLGIRPVWSESSLSAWRNLGSLATSWAQAKTLIILGGCPGWSESSLGARSLCWFWHVAAHVSLIQNDNEPKNDVSVTLRSIQPAPFRVLYLPEAFPSCLFVSFTTHLTHLRKSHCFTICIAFCFALSFCLSTLAVWLSRLKKNGSACYPSIYKNMLHVCLCSFSCH